MPSIFHLFPFPVVKDPVVERLDKCAEAMASYVPSGQIAAQPRFTQDSQGTFLHRS